MAKTKPEAQNAINKRNNIIPFLLCSQYVLQISGQGYKNGKIQKKQKLQVSLLSCGAEVD
jgi:hypothetical protein